CARGFYYGNWGFAYW
nr:immunoglobulin heavy chain junction region [Mus musculus]